MKQKLLRLVADLRFAVSLLLIIILCSIIGTIIEQDQSIQSYKTNYPLTNPLLNIFTWDKILLFGFDHTYKTWWFLCLIFLFGISLITCTFLQQFPSLNLVRRCQFFRITQQFKLLNLSAVLKNSSYSQIFSSIKRGNYNLFQQKNVLYCYKGLTGKIAPILVHFSMVLVLIGTLVSSTLGFKSQEIIPRTEIGHIQNIYSNGQLVSIPNFVLRVNDFWITYNNQKTISQFYSDISILDNYGKELKRQTNFVNSPVIYNKNYCYQTDWNLIGLRFKTRKDQIVEYPLIQVSINNTKFWLTSVLSDQKSNIVLVLGSIEGYGSIYSTQGLFLGNLELYEELSNYQVQQFLDILSSTGLQIKNDPGIPTIYFGSVLIMLSTIISYITYSQIWIIQKNNRIFIGGTTNRAIFDFELEFNKYI